MYELPKKWAIIIVPNQDINSTDANYELCEYCIIALHDFLKPTINKFIL